MAMMAIRPVPMHLRARAHGADAAKQLDYGIGTCMTRRAPLPSGESYLPMAWMDVALRPVPRGLEIKIARSRSTCAIATALRLR